MSFSIAASQQKKQSSSKPSSFAGKKVGLPVLEDKQPSHSNHFRKQDDTHIHKQLTLKLQEWDKAQFTLQMFNDLIQAAKDGDIVSKHWGVAGLRQLLYDEDTAPFDELIQSGIIPYLIEYAKQQEYPELQGQTIFLLGYIAFSRSQAHCQPIVERGAIPLMIEMLRTANFEHADNALTVIVNMSINSNQYRDQIIAEGGIRAVIDFMERHPKIQKMPSVTCRALSKIVRGRPLPASPLIVDAIKVFVRQLDKDTLSDKAVLASCWALADHISNDQYCEILLNKNTILTLLELMESGVDDIIRPCLEIVQELSSKKEGATMLLQSNCLQVFEELLRSENKSVKGNTCQVLANIVSLDSQYTHAILQKQNLIDKVLSLLEKDHRAVRSKICSFIGELWAHTTFEQIKQFYEKNVMKLYVDCIRSSQDSLRNKSTKYLLRCLNSLSKRKEGDKIDLLMELLQKEGGISVIEELVKNGEEEIKENSQKIINLYGQRKVKKLPKEQTVVSQIENEKD